MKENYDIVIIDSGVFKESNTKGIHFYFDNTNAVISDELYEDDVGHGIAINNIIKSHNNNLKIFNIKIFDSSNLSIDEELLIYSLKYIYDKINCKIINLSLGISISFKQAQLYEICNKLAKSGITIVAAFDNMRSISYPAAFDNVIGVLGDENLKKTTDIISTTSKIVNVCAKGGLQRVKWLDNKYIFSMGSSFACAHVVGILSKIECSCLEKAIEYLTSIAICKYDVDNNNSNQQNYSEIYKDKKAIIFPFNKEMHSLIRFKHLLNFQITDIYDIKYSAKLGASANKLLGMTDAKDYIIKNIDKIDWDSFDILILGHTEELISAVKKLI